MEEGENLARTIPTSNPDPDQEQGSSGVWCVASGGKERKRSRALAPVRPASDAARAAIGSRIRKKEKRHTHPVEPKPQINAQLQLPTAPALVTTTSTDFAFLHFPRTFSKF